MKRVALEVFNAHAAFDVVLIRAIDRAGAVMLFLANDTVVMITDQSTTWRST